MPKVAISTSSVPRARRHQLLVVDRKCCSVLSMALFIEFAVFSVIVVAPTTSTSAGSTGTSDSTESDSLPNSSSAAALSYPIQTGLIGLFSLLGFALA